jgi:hypothetical protein
MRLPRRPILLAAAALLLGLRPAAADDAKPAAEPKAAKAKDSRDAKEAIAWRPVWIDAVEEAAERNILLFLHSHAST